MIVQFICGCRTGEIVDRANIETMSSVSFDEEGMLICALHGQRRRGWRSVERGRPLYSNTPQEREAQLLFDEPLPKRVAMLNSAYPGEVKPNIKDNRDPEDVTREMGLRPFKGRVAELSD